MTSKGERESCGSHCDLVVRTSVIPPIAKCAMDRTRWVCHREQAKNSVSNHTYGRSSFRYFFLKPPAFKKASAGRTDEVEQRHPHEEQGDDGDGDGESNDFVRHVISPSLTEEAV
jgi:hypothetical protein